MPLPLHVIEAHVETFLKYARRHPELQFRVTKVGCGLAGYKKEQIKPMFMDAPANCSFADWEK
jgi:hypothetical protein